MFDSKQRDEIAALASVSNKANTPDAIGAFEGVASSTQDWVRDAAMFKTAECHYRAGHFEPVIGICHQLLAGAPEDSVWRGRILLLLASSTMSNAALEESQTAEVAAWLDEAIDAFTDNRDPYWVGRATRELGVLAHWKGEIQDGSALIGLGQTLASANTGSGAPDPRRAAGIQLAG